MQNITIIDKASLNKINTDSSNILLDKVSIIQTKLYKGDIAEIIQNGNDLVIKLKNGETITLENYFVKDANGQTSDLVFEGTVCAFEQMVWEDGVAAFKELTGLEELLPIVTGSSGGIGGLPWIIGGVVAGGIGAVVGGGSSNNGDNGGNSGTLPDILNAPTISILTDKNNDGHLSGKELGGLSTVNVSVGLPDGVHIGDTITVTDQTGKEYTHTVTNEDIDAGVVTVKVDRPVEGGELKVTATVTNDAGKSQESLPDSAVVDTVLPSLTIEVPATGKDNTPTITGKTDEPAGSEIEITITDKDGATQTVTTTVKEDGSYTVDVPNGLPDGNFTVVGKVTDPAGNTTTATDKGNIDSVPPSLTIEVPAIGNDSTPTISGKTDEPAGSEIEITITDKDGAMQTVTTTVKEDGSYTVDVPNGLPDGEFTVDGKVTDPAGNTTTATDKGNIDSVPPSLTIEVPAIGNDSTPTITGKTDEPAGSQIEITITDQDGATQTVTTTVKEDGSYTVDVPNGLPDGEFTVVGKVTDPAGNTTTATDQGKIDSVLPTVEVIINADHSVTFKFSEQVTGFDPTDIIVVGAKLAVDSLIDHGDGTWTAQLIGINQGTTIEVTVKDQSYSDLAGNKGTSGIDKEITINIDNITPSGNGSMITGQTEPNQKVTITMEDGTVVGTTTSDANGHWTLTTTEPLKDGGTITAATPGQDGKIVTDDAPLPFVSINVVAGDDIINQDELADLTDSEGNITISGTVSNPTAHMTVTFNGKEYPTTPNADGTWQIKVPASEVHEDKPNLITASGVVSTTDGKEIHSNEADRPVDVDTVPPSLTIEVPAIGNDSTPTISGKTDEPASSQIEITITDQDGATQTVTTTVKEDGSYTVDVPNGLPDGEFTVVGKVTDPAGNTTTATDKGNIDTVPPSVKVGIDPNGDITITFDPDVDPYTIDPNTDFVITGKDGSPITVTMAPSEDGLTWTGKIPNGVDTEITVKVPAIDGKGNPTYLDKVGNAGVAGQNTVSVDTKAPSVEITYDTETGSFDIRFSEVPFGGTGINGELTADDLKNILKVGNIAAEFKVVIDEKDHSKFTVKVDPVDRTQGIEITIEDKSYTDKTGNLGIGNIADHLPPKASNDSATVTEAGTKNGNVDELGKSVAKGDVFNNDDKNLKVFGIKFGESSIEFGESSTEPLVVETKYGTFTFNSDGTYTYLLDNARLETQALKQGEKVTETIIYTARDKNGFEVSAELKVSINGTNDFPKITQNEPANDIEVTGGNIKNSPNAFENGDGGKTHTLKFNLGDQQDESSANIVINLEKLDNSFIIKVNGKSIHIDNVFQVQSNDDTTPTQVPLIFADGTWLSTGNPWNINENGLPRFQIILTENGVRFFGTKSTTSKYLEEIFFKDASDLDGLRLPDFLIGENTVDIINVNGTGTDAMKGYMTVTAKGKFTLSDFDSDHLSKAVITLENYQAGDQFTPVLPKGITYSTQTINGKLILTLQGNATKDDYEDALNNLMFKGSASGNREIEVKIYDDNAAFSTMNGTLNYAGSNKFVTLTQTDFTTPKYSALASKMSPMLDQDIIFDLLNDDNLGGHLTITENDFIVGSAQKINLTHLLDSTATELNIHDYLDVQYDESTQTATLTIDRDGQGTHYQTENLLLLTQQNTKFDLDELLKNNQIIF